MKPPLTAVGCIVTSTVSRIFNKTELKSYASFHNYPPVILADIPRQAPWLYQGNV
jgi:hypothetical protein